MHSQILDHHVHLSTKAIRDLDSGIIFIMIGRQEFFLDGLFYQISKFRQMLPLALAVVPFLLYIGPSYQSYLISSNTSFKKLV